MICFIALERFASEGYNYVLLLSSYQSIEFNKNVSYGFRKQTFVFYKEISLKRVVMKAKFQNDRWNAASFRMFLLWLLHWYAKPDRAHVLCQRSTDQLSVNEKSPRHTIAADFF